jgi:hypothetical protein
VEGGGWHRQICEGRGGDNRPETEGRRRGQRHAAANLRGRVPPVVR